MSNGLAPVEPSPMLLPSLPIAWPPSLSMRPIQHAPDRGWPKVVPRGDDDHRSPRPVGPLEESPEDSTSNHLATDVCVPPWAHTHSGKQASRRESQPGPAARRNRRKRDERIGPQALVRG